MKPSLLRLFTVAMAVALASFVGSWKVNAQPPFVCEDKGCHGPNCYEQDFMNCDDQGSTCSTSCCYPDYPELCPPPGGDMP